MATLRTACPLDCPDGCSLEVELEGERVVRVDGSHVHPLTEGFICGKVRGFADRLYGEHRLQTPLVRTGAKGEAEFREASWDEALELVATRIREVVERSGGEAVLPLAFGGSNGKLTDGSFDMRFFRRLGASELARTVCAETTGTVHTGLYGGMPGLALPDYEHAKLIVVWGTNPSATGIHLVPIVKRAQAAGAKLVVVDPRRTPLAKKADLHLAVRPGGDLPLALAVHRFLFETGAADEAFLREHTTGADALRERASEWTLERAAEASGVAAPDIEAFARMYAETRPTALRCGWGLERNRCGGSAVAAVLALPAVAGHFGVRGGGFTMSQSPTWRLDLDEAASVPPARTRTINQNRVGEALLGADPPVEVAFVYNHNPVATLPAQEKVRRGFEREDLFTVVLEQVMTDTARHADVVLPITTFLEHDDLAAGYGAFSMSRLRPVVPRVGESRTNAEVFTALEERLGLARPGDARTADELAARLLDQPPAKGFAESIATVGYAKPAHDERPVQLVDVWPGTPDGKVHLCPPALDAAAPHGLYAWQPDPATDALPLALISPALSRTISSTFGERHTESVPLEMHPDDARARRLAGGERVRVWNELGEVLCDLALSSDLARGVVSMPKGIWCHNTHNGNTSNALAPDTLSDVGEGACFNDARVQVERAPAPGA